MTDYTSGTDAIRRLPEMLTVAEAARIAKCSNEVIYRAVNATAEPWLVSHRIGSRIRITPPDLADWIDKQKA